MGWNCFFLWWRVRDFFAAMKPAKNYVWSNSGCLLLYLLCRVRRYCILYLVQVVRLYVVLVLLVIFLTKNFSNSLTRTFCFLITILTQPQLQIDPFPIFERLFTLFQLIKSPNLGPDTIHFLCQRPATTNTRATCNTSKAFDTAKVTNFSRMFEGASSFNQPITMNMRFAKDMECMFCDASSFNQSLMALNDMMHTAFKQQDFKGATALEERHLRLL